MLHKQKKFFFTFLVLTIFLKFLENLELDSGFSRKYHRNIKKKFQKLVQHNYEIKN